MNDNFIDNKNFDDAITFNAYNEDISGDIDTASGETIQGSSKSEILKSERGSDTIIGGKGNDTLIGGSGSDVFYYSLGDGNDVITDYTDVENINHTLYEDAVVLNGVSVTKVNPVKKSPADLIFNVKKGSIRLNKSTNKLITFKDTSNNILLRQQFGTSYIHVNDFSHNTVNTAIDAAVVTIDSSERTDDVNIIGNTKANYIKLGTGNTTVTTGKGKDTIEYFGGNAVITDYAAGSDLIKFRSDIVSAKLSGSNIVFTTDKGGTLTLNSATDKNGKPKKITVMEKNGLTYSQTFGTSTLTVGNLDGDTVVANSDVTVINASKRSKPVFLASSAYGDTTIKGGAKNDTISSGIGNDYLTGGKGNDVFIISGGHDTIGDYSISKNNSDQIKLNGIRMLNYYVDGKNVIIKLNSVYISNILEDTSLTIINGKDKYITINGSAQFFNDYREKIFDKKDTTSTYNTQSRDDSWHTVKLIDASKKTSSINITGNNFDDGTVSTIKGGTKADTLQGGYGDDILTGGRGADLFIYAGGNDTITDYTAGTDVVSLAKGIELISAKYINKDLEFTTNGGTLLIKNAIKKNKDQKITVIGKYGLQTSQVYGRTKLTIGAKDGNTFYLSHAINSDVTTIDASSRSAKSPITIFGSTKVNNITGTKGDDTIDLLHYEKRDKTTIKYTAGNDTIKNFHPEDTLNLSKGQSLATATKVSDTNYKITVNKGKRAVGVLDISGYFAVSTETSKLYAGKGANSSNIYFDITSYVHVGDKKVPYKVETRISSDLSKYEEFFDDFPDTAGIFDDTVMSTACELDDIASMNIKDNSVALYYSSLSKNEIGEISTNPNISEYVDNISKKKL